MFGEYIIGAVLRLCSGSRISIKGHSLQIEVIAVKTKFQADKYVYKYEIQIDWNHIHLNIS